MSIYDLSWNKNDFQSKLKLFVASHDKEKSWQSSSSWFDRTEAYTALASTCYAIAGSAHRAVSAHKQRGQWHLLLFDLFTWLPLGAICYWLMCSYAHRAFQEAGNFARMTPGQCDVQQSILRRQGKWGWAEYCIQIALEGSNFVPLHTHALLLIGRAECYMHLPYDARMITKVVAESAIEANRLADTVSRNDPRQAVRIYRGVADLYDHLYGARNDYAVRALEKAKQLAHETGALDQLAKM